SDEIIPLIQPTLRAIKQHAHTALEEIPTCASVSLLDSGIVMTGGLAQLSGLTEHLSEEMGLHVRVAPDPVLAAVLGLGQLLEEKSNVSIQDANDKQTSSDRDQESSPAKI